MASMIPMAAGIGQQDAKNPGANVGSSWMHNKLAQFDPVGKWIVGQGGDPWNLYGEKSNPNALFFPSGDPNAPGSGGVPTTLPTLPGISAPRFYAPASFSGYANLGPGRFNQMASQLAGPMYQPQSLPLPKSPKPTGPGQATMPMPAPIRPIVPIWRTKP